MKKVGKLAVALVVMAAAIGMMGCAQPSGGNDNPVVKPDYSTCVVGDFILKDGSILSKNETPTSDTVAAVIVRAADKSTNTPALGVGIVHNRLLWCQRYTDNTYETEIVGYSTIIEALVGDETSGYMNGSDSWALLNNAVSNDAANNPDYYPAWKFCKDYATGKNFSDALATGWYLPTIAELKTIYDNNENNEDVIDASLTKAGGNTFKSGHYWSCCQAPYTYYLAQKLSFNDGHMNRYQKNQPYSVCAVRAFN